MELAEKTLESKTIFDGKIIKVQVDQALLPDGHQALREVCRHPGGVAVLALTEEGTVYLVRQFRYPLGEELLELPAGKLEYGEDPFLAGQRELSEETGLEARAWVDLGKIYSSPGFCDEKIHLYFARDLIRKESHLDEEEFLDVETMPLSELVEKCCSGEISDGKTVAAVLKVQALLQRERGK